MASYVRAHLAMGCAGVLAMPNTKPPVSRVTGEATEEAWSIECYSQMLQAAGADEFEFVTIPLYLTSATTPQMIEEGAAGGQLKACKYYPPHGTTNSEHGVPMNSLIGSDILRAMEAAGTILCLHGEQHALVGSDYFDARKHAEASFYTETMPRLAEAHPNLKMVCEHVTSKEAVRFVQDAGERVGATITPQHLLYTVGHLIQGLRYHLYCLPIVKFEEDREALRNAATRPGQTQFFAGTDSAPHTTKATPCGCAAGCFTGGCAPQLYAMAFEESGLDLMSAEAKETFKRFLCYNGPDFYQISPTDETFTLVREDSVTEALPTPEGDIVPLPLGMDLTLTWSLG